MSHGGDAVGLLIVPASGFLLACGLILGLALIFLGAASLLRWSAQRGPASPT